MFFKSFQFKLFGSFIFFGLVLSLITMSIFTKVIEDGYLSHKTDLFYDMIQKNKEQILIHQGSMNKKVETISLSPLFKNILSNNKDLKEVLNLVLLSDKDFFKVTYIDNSGKNIIDVTQDDIKLVETNKKQLYKKILSLAKNQTYSTQFLYDFVNEIPYYKIAKRTDYGFLVVYIDLRNSIFDKIKSTYKENWYLVDKNGNFIIHKNKKHNWQNIKEDSSYNLKDEFPNNYKDILNTDVFFVDRLMSEKLTLLNNEEVIIVLSHTQDFTGDLKKDYYELFKFTLIIAVFVSSFLAFVLSKPFIKINKRINNLNSELDKQVKERTAELSTSLDLIDKYIITSKTDRKGIITYVSEAFCKISGYSKDELIGKPHNIIRDPENPNVLFEQLWQKISKGEDWSGEIQNISKSGEKYCIYSNIAPLYKNGKITGHMAVAKNITDKIKLRKLNEELEQRVEDEIEKNIIQHNKHIADRVKSAQLTSIGQLAAGITHEINTPLTYIKGNVEMMKYDVEDISDDRIRENLSSDFVKIDDGIKRIEGIIDTMREVSQSTKENPEETNLYETLVIALNMINNRAKQISQIYINEHLFEAGLDKKEIIINCNIQKQRVEQLWIVILNNALDVLEKIEDYEQRKIQIDIRNDDKIVNVKIKDNGGGIPDEVIDNIFDPIFTTKKHAGLGVGLNVAKKIVDDQGGEIKAYNEDAGAVFEVNFNVS